MAYFEMETAKAKLAKAQEEAELAHLTKEHEKRYFKIKRVTGIVNIILSLALLGLLIRFFICSIG